MPNSTFQKDSTNKKTVESVNQLFSENVLAIASSIKDRLLEEIEQLGVRLPKNAIDQLVDELGGPSNVADLTGRRSRLVENQVFVVCCTI